MKDKLTIMESNGVGKTADAITFFSIAENGKKYVIYTFNEIDSNGLIKLHVSRVVTENDQHRLEKIEDENEWTNVKEIMKDIIVGGNAQ